MKTISSPPFWQIPLPAYPALDWSRIAALPVNDCREALIAPPNNAKLRITPCYYQQGINGALPTILLRETVAHRLQQAVTLLPDDYGIEVLDGWRPLAVQQALREQMRAQIAAKHPDFDAQQIQSLLDEFAADPNRSNMVFPHHTGGSVDVRLFNRDTSEIVPMGNEFDEITPRSYSLAFEHSDSAIRRARRLLIHAMRQVGFTNIPTEWWHFDYGNQNWSYFSGNRCAYYGAALPP